MNQIHSRDDCLMIRPEMWTYIQRMIRPEQWFENGGIYGHQTSWKTYMPIGFFESVDKRDAGKKVQKFRKKFQKRYCNFLKSRI